MLGTRNSRYDPLYRVRILPHWMRWTAPTTGITMCHIADAVEQRLESAYGYNLPSEPPPHHVRSYSSFGPLSANVWNLVVFVRSALRSGHDGC